MRFTQRHIRHLPLIFKFLIFSLVFTEDTNLLTNKVKIS